MGNSLLLKKKHDEKFVSWLSKKGYEYKFACGNQWLMVRIKIGRILCWRRIYQCRHKTYFTVDNDLVELVRLFKNEVFMSKQQVKIINTEVRSVVINHHIFMVEQFGLNVKDESDFEFINKVDSKGNYVFIMYKDGRYFQGECEIYPDRYSNERLSFWHIDIIHRETESKITI